MEVVPVLDLKSGVVVLAGGGERDAYQPVDTLLCHDPAPAAVMEALLAFHPFGACYIADLDQIERRGSNRETVCALAGRWPAVEFWLDAGISRPADVERYAGIENIRFVVGSESLRSLDDYAALNADKRFAGHILSLDRKAGAELGPASLIARPDLWPQTVIAMDLDHVGAGRGPNRERLLALRASRRDTDIAAAGGIRGIEDLRQLADDGITHALIATALHQKTLHADDLARLHTGKKNAP